VEFKHGRFINISILIRRARSLLDTRNANSASLFFLSIFSRAKYVVFNYRLIPIARNTIFMKCAFHAQFGIQRMYLILKSLSNYKYRPSACTSAWN